MYETHHDEGESDVIHTTVTFQNAKDVRQCGPRRALTVTIGNVDLPAFLSDGLVYIQAPLPLIFEAFVEDLPAFIIDLEIGVSTKGGTPLSLAGDGRAFLISPVAEPGVVRSCRFDR